MVREERDAGIARSTDSVSREHSRTGTISLALPAVGGWGLRGGGSTSHMTAPKALNENGVAGLHHRTRKGGRTSCTYPGASVSHGHVTVAVSSSRQSAP